MAKPTPAVVLFVAMLVAALVLVALGERPTGLGLIATAVAFAIKSPFSKSGPRRIEDFLVAVVAKDDDRAREILAEAAHMPDNAGYAWPDGSCVAYGLLHVARERLNEPVDEPLNPTPSIERMDGEQ